MNQRFVLKRIAGIVTVAIAAGAAAGVGQSGHEAMLARAKTLELLTKYVPPPGDPLSHHASGYAKILCSAVFVTGLDAAFAAENVGYFTAPYVERAKLKYAVDHAAKAVTVTLPNGSVRTAKYFGDRGCITLLIGKALLDFTPKDVKSTLPDPETQPWPMSDVLCKDPPPSGVDVAKVQKAVDAAFDPREALTAAFVVTHQGRLIGERYGDGITHTTPLSRVGQWAKA